MRIFFREYKKMISKNLVVYSNSFTHRFYWQYLGEAICLKIGHV